MANVDGFTKLPAPSVPPPSLDSGTVALYRDDSWDSGSLMLHTGDYALNQRHTIPGDMFDNATFAAFNLPVGTVMTLMDNVAPVDGRTIPDLRKCGRSVDLVGTGQTEGVDLRAVNMNDLISSFFWRKVNLDLGAIELFEDANYSGGRVTLFLSEWEREKVHSIGDWWLQDKVSSVRWRALGDRQTAQLFDNADGSGESYSNIKGYGTLKEIANLKDVRLNDRVSAFRWYGIIPKKEIIAPFEVKVSSASTAEGAHVVAEGTNNNTIPLPVKVNYNTEEMEEATVSTTDTHAVGVTTTFSLTAGASAPGATAEMTFSVELSYSYTHSGTTTTSTVKKVGLSVAAEPTAPPRSRYKAKVVVTLGKMPPTVYETTAERWYDQPVTGAVADAANNGWYKRVEPVRVTVAGSLACGARVDMDATPID